MSFGQLTPQKICLNCGARVDPRREVCWLCYAPQPTGRASDDQAMQTATPCSPEPVGSFTLASLMILVTLVAVVLGVFTIAPGAGVLLGFILLVVWLRTAAAARNLAIQGKAVTRTERVQLFFSSLGVTVVLLAMTCVAGFAAFWAACFACMGTYVGLESVFPENLAMTIAWIVCAVVAVAIVAATSFGMRGFNRYRWNRDVGSNKDLKR